MGANLGVGFDQPVRALTHPRSAEGIPFAEGALPLKGEGAGRRPDAPREAEDQTGFSERGFVGGFDARDLFSDFEFVDQRR